MRRKTLTLELDAGRRGRIVGFGIILLRAEGSETPTETLTESRPGTVTEIVSVNRQRRHAAGPHAAQLLRRRRAVGPASQWASSVVTKARSS